jgi:hypothetical protein
MMAIGLGVQAAGSIVGGINSSTQAKSQQAMANYNAKVQEQTAKAIEQQTVYKSRRAAEEENRTAGELAANLGAAGVDPSAGSPLLIQAQQQIQNDLENLNIGYQGQIGAQRARSGAALDRMQADIYGQRATNDLTSGFVSAGSSLLQGFGKMDWTKKPPTTDLGNRLSYTRD